MNDNKFALTSIALLRNSDAMTSRVNTVANNLKKINPEWKEEWFFPVIAVGLSNAFDDVSWVFNSDEVLADVDVSYTVGTLTVKGSDLKSGLGMLEASFRTRDDIQKELHALNAGLELLAAGARWENGFVLAPVASNSVQKTEEQTSVGTEGLSKEDDPVSTITQQLVHMETADIMAILTAVNAARGGLLRGAQPDELTTFLRSVTGNHALTVDWPAGIAA